LRPVSIATSWSASTFSQPEVAGGVAEPVALGLTLAGVIVLGAFGNLVEAVAVLAAPSFPIESISLNALGEAGRDRSCGP
jgi:hypothetical protein